MLETRQPARQAMAMPSPVAPRGAVENWYTRPAPPAAMIVARATCAATLPVAVSSA
jgi:hypothetical protein